MEKEKATIHEYARMCKSQEDCTKCPIAKTISTCHLFIEKHPDKANEIILKWCEEHPAETRQDRFLKMFPNARVDTNGILVVCPKIVNINNKCTVIMKECGECCKEYWLAEVDENDAK